MNVIILDMGKISKEFLKRLDHIEEVRKNKTFKALFVDAFPPILSYDELEAIAMPQQQLVEAIGHD
ncbi:hypothetical protein [Acinetobacter bereziniae]|uniref:hypothetical protein n=1 Tax=Acinetobacter bereziniae TaxID=106648 RepID=UPI002953CD0E|nr:hypothetical protein [Acinetobacter bereziniae]MDV8157994.1 hypothetical protein [Acinetobacter bereziniae]